MLLKASLDVVRLPEGQRTAAVPMRIRESVMDRASRFAVSHQSRYCGKLAGTRKLNASYILIVLGIETSCDETSAAVVDDDRTIWSNGLSHDEGTAFGVAPKSPLGHISKCWMAWSGGCRMRSRSLDIDGCGHRRAGADRRRIVGIMTAKAMAAAANNRRRRQSPKAMLDVCPTTT